MGEENGLPFMIYLNHKCPDCQHDADAHVIAVDHRCLVCGCRRYE
jgi:hypothetical protein